MSITHILGYICLAIPAITGLLLLAVGLAGPLVRRRDNEWY